MEILWITSMFPFPPNNGGKVVVSNRIVQVSKKHRIHLLVEDEVKKEGLLVAEKYCESVDVVTPRKRTRLYNLYYFIAHSYNVGKYYDPRISAEISRCVKQYSINLINIDAPMLCVNVLPIADCLTHIPIVINQHNIEYSNVRSKLFVTGLNPLLRAYALIESNKLKRWEKSLYSQGIISAQIFLSKDDYELFKKDYPRLEMKYLLSPIGTMLPNNPVEKVCAKRGKTIVFPAAFDYGPNIHGAKWFVTYVFPYIKTKIPDVVVYLVGKDPSPDIIKMKSKDVFVTGTVESMDPYMHMADLFIVPLFFGGGVKTKLIEMASWNKPIVSTTFGCKGTLFENMQDVIVEDSPEKFGEKCLEVLQNPQRFAKMAKNAFCKVDKYYLWDNIGESYCGFLEELVE